MAMPGLQTKLVAKEFNLSQDVRVGIAQQNVLLKNINTGTGTGLVILSLFN